MAIQKRNLIILEAICIALVFVFLFPFVLVLFNAGKSSADMSSIPLAFLPVLHIYSLICIM